MPNGNYNKGAFPQEVAADRQIMSSGSASTSLAITMPTNLKVGDLIEVPVVTDTSVTITPGAGFGIHRSSGNHTFQVFWKYADGTEGASQTWTASAATKFVASAHRIVGVDPTVNPTVGAGAAGTVGSNASNTGGITAAWGSANNLFMAFIAAAPTTSDISVSGFPSGYSSTSQVHLIGAVLGTSFDAVAGVASPNGAQTLSASIGGSSAPTGLLLAFKPHP